MSVWKYRWEWVMGWLYRNHHDIYKKLEKDYIKHLKGVDISKIKGGKT